MFDHLKDSWQALRGSTPGERFQRYHAQRQGRRLHAAARIAQLTLGALIVLIGIVLLPAPGPGTLVVLAGACILARESATVARALDRLEVKARQIWPQLQRRLARAPKPRI
ncbi:MAG TPA: PGPGW domain-containing protein [Solimonas sp.]